MIYLKALAWITAGLCAVMLFMAWRISKYIG